ncbi:MAG: ABC transporter ATP-binding protein [Aigarchaeota archaeon]|nr:ABC transporter ATP-binding protein [Aigarchaeota archaeon]MDW8092709.1 ABC transporter ATP-binding protein [Nitrososphaerota archaeon]
MPEIVVQGLTKTFIHKTTGQKVTAIERLDFEIGEGEIVGIVGKTGCGKSTFLSILLGVERPTEGRVLVDGKEPYRDFYYFKGKISAIFQQDLLLPWRTAIENVKLGLEILNYPKEKQIDISKAWLAKVGLEKFLNSYPGELSGGMRQRVAIARAFAINPEIILADEAFGHLDVVTATTLREDFNRLVREQKKTAVIVTHQLDEAVDMVDRVLVFGRPARLVADLQVPNGAKQSISEKKEFVERLHNLIENSG